MGLSFANRSEEGAIQSLCQGDISDIVHSHVSVDTRLHIPIRIDVKVSPPSGDATLDVRPIIPEIENKQWFNIPEIHHLLSEAVPLLRRNHEMNIPLTVDG